MICSISIFPSNCLKVVFRVKTSEVEEIVIKKWCKRWLDLLTSMLLLGPGLHCVGPLVLWGFLQHLRAKYQRWSPRGRPWPRRHILKSLALALASKVKSLALALASRPQVLENWPVLGSRTARFFGMLKFCGALKNFFGKRFLVEIA